MSNQQFAVDPKQIRLSVRLLMVGIVLTFLAGTFHPDHAPANIHIAAFLKYAGDSTWIVTHLGQFARMAVLIAGNLVQASALDLLSLWAGRFGILAAAISLGLYGILQAVDGVALKQAVDAWANASEAENPFALPSPKGSAGWNGRCAATRVLHWACRSC